VLNNSHSLTLRWSVPIPTTSRIDILFICISTTYERQVEYVSLFLFNNKKDEQQAIGQIIVKVKKNKILTTV
jgi:hypothetical protein